MQAEQPGLRQRRQQNSSPASGFRASRREYRDDALAQQPEPGQRPLPVPRHRVRQHRQHPRLRAVRIREVRVRIREARVRRARAVREVHVSAVIIRVRHVRAVRACGVLA